MFQPFVRAIAALLLPLALAACMLVPGKFVSTLTINADRSFAYTYQGEVHATDVVKDLPPGTLQGAPRPDPATTKAERDRKAREIAAALSREAGYRKIEYIG